MSNLYDAGCRTLLAHGTKTTSDPTFRECLVLTRITSSAGLLTSILVILFVIMHRYVFTVYYLTRVYGKSYALLEPRQQSRLRCHHLDLFAKVISLAFIAQPVFMVLWRGRSWSDFFSTKSDFTFGDSASVGTATIAAAFLFEIASSETLGLLPFVHHVGSILTIQGYYWWSVAQPIDMDAGVGKAKTMANICLLWAFFACIFGSIKSVGNIMRRCFVLKRVTLRQLCLGVFCIDLIVAALEAFSVLYAVLGGWSEIPSGGQWVILFLQTGFSVSKWEHIRPFYAIYRRGRS
ncbi:hypothetical protein BDV38DRAFT_289052 [Aspergillus pseudotamarii]|uniref:TLC domain-containing protein n=1 Tax=Aspergillus pseudotamarii TaxID=132259 RepID=A0A5N6SB48_ASPPS|nr:uncharacterized protein BDV38DRAFT_289052 [Aspergillus pseudotamarii]KAE8131069.1 hypothetical protein BDV38DRAFT_289052 [Aspergillus pseudotamarii]